MTGVAIGFLAKPLSIPLDRILPSRRLPDTVTQSKKYLQIRASIEEVDLIEPLSVTAVEKSSGTHMLLDGHVRLAVMRELGYAESPCLVATDDESYTYNNRINRLSTVQEHLMIKRAIERGVSRERLARALSLDMSYIAKKMNLLDGICPEAAELLKDRHFPVDITATLRKMKPTRQVECVEVMISTNCFTLHYARSLLGITPPEMLVNGKPAKKVLDVSEDQMQLMQREMTALQNQYKLVEEDYSDDMLHLVLAQTYLAKLLANTAVSRFLQAQQPEILEHFRSIVEAVSAES